MDTTNQYDIYDEETGQLAEDYTPEEEIKDILGNQEATVYPNPTKGDMVIKITNMQKETAANIILYDTQGKEVINLTKVKKYNHIDISNKPDGIYIMRITIGSNFMEWKVVKM